MTQTPAFWNSWYVEVLDYNEHTNTYLVLRPCTGRRYHVPAREIEIRG